MIEILLLIALIYLIFWIRGNVKSNKLARKTFKQATKRRNRRNR